MQGFLNFLKLLGWYILKFEGHFLPFTKKSLMAKWGCVAQLHLAFAFKPFAGQFLIVAESPSDA